MNANLDKIAQDLYGKIQTRFPNIKIGDENAGVLSKKQDIPKARFFEFEYTEDGEPLGTIAITLDEDDGIVVQVSGDLVNDDDNTTHHGAYKFIRSFRQFAKDRLLNFDVQNIGKSNMDKRDYQYQAKQKEEPAMPQQPVMESKMYGNARMSYQDLGEARLVVKHSQPINVDLPTGRTMHIESIYIENAEGERFKYPYKHLNGARALAEHIKHGGTPYDSIGQYISGLSEELASLRKFKGYVSRQSQISETMGGVTNRVIERIEEIKDTINKLQRPAYYETFAESFEEQEEQMIPEEVANDLIDRLTIRTFNEELKSVFPYIYKFVDESELPVVELGVDDLVGEEQLDERATPEWMEFVAKAKELLSKGMSPEQVAKQLGVQGPNNGMAGPMGGQWGAINSAQRELQQSQKPALESPEEAFESFLEDIVREDKDEIFSPNKDAQNAAIEKLNDIMKQELKGGPEGVNAIESLRGLIDDPAFLDSLRDIDPDLDVRPLVQQYVLNTDPEVATHLHFGSGEKQELEATPPAPAPAVPPAPAPAAPAPAAAAPEAPPAEPAAMPPAEPAPAPVAEGKDEEPPFEPDAKPHGKTTAGKHGQGYSQARHLARQGLAKAIANAKKAGATLDTKIDFGHKEMTLHDAIKECGMTPMECGFEAEDELGGLNGMMKFISGFYNREAGNFPLGGQRIKIKVKKAFEDGEFGEANPDDLMRVLKFIDMKDPSSDHHQQQAIIKLAGVRGHDHELEEEPVDPRIAKLQSLLQQLGQSANQTASNFSNVSSSSTQRGSINGNPANYDDAMNKFKQMRLKFGDDEIDFNNPDQAGEKMRGMVGGMMKGMQGQVPNQNIEFPGGQMNPADMMKQIMQKINFDAK